MLSNLVSQILAAPPKVGPTLRMPICPECLEAPRARGAVSGKLQAHCAACNVKVCKARREAAKARKSTKEEA